MLTKIEDIIEISKIHDVPFEDMLFLNFSLNGITYFPPYVRIRFEFIPTDQPWYATSKKMDIGKYFFALPNTPNSIYMIDGGCILFNSRVIGIVRNIEEDTCDSSYFRRKQTVLTLNPVSKSLCRGCKFCHTLQQTPRDRVSLIEKASAREFIEEWMIKYNLIDLSHLIQVSIVTGCFGSEQKVVDYLKMIKNLLYEYGFRGLLFYYGSEITSGSKIEELREIESFSLCLSIECFSSRDIMLKNTKGKLNIDVIKRILSKARENNIETSFSYILGIEPLDILEPNFISLLPFINRFPTINIFQVHRGHELLRISGAWDIDYYLKARKIIEDIFLNTQLRPKPWENYRSLWHLKFGKEDLNDVRTPL